MAPHLHLPRRTVFSAGVILDSVASSKLSKDGNATMSGVEMAMEAYAIDSKKPARSIRATDTTRDGPGDREVFTALVRAHDHRMRMLAYRLLEDAHAMDDVLQEAYLKAYRAFGSFRHDASAGTWLYRIVYNCCMDHLRGTGRLKAHGNESIERLAENGFDPASDFRTDDFDCKDELRAALSTLTHEQRAAVVLVDALGYDYESAASILGVRGGTIATRLHRARTTLRERLSATRKEDAR
jgi:RNA polymerase sigma-70 factor, ECF subfamily